MLVIQAVIKKAASPEILSGYTSILDAAENCFDTDLSYDRIAELVRQQLEDGRGWEVITYSVDGTGASEKPYSLSTKAYVMIPDEDTVEKAKALIDKIAADEKITQEEAEYMQAYTIIGKDGTMSMNCPEIPIKFRSTDPIEYSRAVTYGRRMLRNISQYLIKHLPGFENAYISREAVMLGARESWRIRGKYYLVEDDYHNQSRFEDAVARTAWFIDAHGEKISEKLPRGGFYEIPYRSLVSDRIENLIVTGRCISASFILQASMRIQLTCMSIGEAAGIAAAYSIKNNIAANEVQWARVPNRSYVSEPRKA